MKGRRIGCGTIVLALVAVALLRVIFTPLLGGKTDSTPPPPLPENVNVSVEQAVPERASPATPNTVTTQDGDGTQQEVSQMPTQTEPVEKPQKNGFNAAANTKFTLGHVYYSIPSYFSLNQSTTTETKRNYSAMEGNVIAAILTISSMETEISQAEFQSGKEALLKSLMGDSAQSVETFERDIAGLSGISGSCTVTHDGLSVAGFATVALYADAKEAFFVQLLQFDNSQYDYTGDYKKILGAVTLNTVEKPAPVEKPSSIVSPDFKAVMDSYEAFFDEYVEFMKKYEALDSSDNPMAALSWLSDYMDWMNRYEETMDKLNNIDSDSLSIADYAYYVEVTARINKKLLEAAN